VEIVWFDPCTIWWTGSAGCRGMRRPLASLVALVAIEYVSDLNRVAAPDASLRRVRRPRWGQCLRSRPHSHWAIGCATARHAPPSTARTHRGRRGNWGGSSFFRYWLVAHASLEQRLEETIHAPLGFVIAAIG